jgi:hypothetical protein
MKNASFEDGEKSTVALEEASLATHGKVAATTEQPTALGEKAEVGGATSFELLRGIQ